MSRRIDYRSSSPRPADEFAAAVLDEAYLRARLERIGGPGAQLVEHTADGDGGRYRLRHGIDRAALPSVVASLVSGNLVIERTESLRRVSDGHWAGQVDVRVPGTPAAATGTIRVDDGPGGGCTQEIGADVTVTVPLFGGQIESVIAEQVRTLLEAETAFTEDWLAKRPA